MKRNSLVKIIIFIFALCLVAGFYLFINLPSPIIISQPFSIAKGESTGSISFRLKQDKFIYSDLIFRFYLKLTNSAKDIKAGYYLIPPRVTLINLVNFLTDNKNINDGIFLIKEGETLKDIETNLRQHGILTEITKLSDFKIKDFKDRYPLLFKDAPIDNNLEGYLFPDSYHFPPNSSANDIIKVLLTNSQNKLQENKLLDSNNGHTFYENLIMASILEKEVQDEIDKRMVADILWRRFKINMPLQVDASICYAINQSFNDCQLSDKAFKIDSPYNTYLYKGLPPAPICNPGLESIKATLNPLANDSWYYLSDRKTGKTIYSKTLEEHNLARQKYL